MIEPLPPERWLPAPVAAQVERLLRQGFAARRKMLRNSLGGLVPPERMAEIAARAGVDLSQRPQEIAPPRWVALAEALAETPAAAPPTSLSPPAPMASPAGSLPHPDA